MSDRRPDEALYAAERARANLASLRRNDPSIQSIVASTTHCTLHQWNEGTERWDKLKQEGAVFVVRRERAGLAPEDAVFLLNRSGTKNWALPLEPGEMKVMMGEEGESLTIARRGDRTRRKIWFSEGKEAAKRFEQVLFQICGPPSQRPPSAVTGAVDGATPSSKGSSNSASSDLDRLLGNLSMSSGSSPARPRSSTPSSASRPHSRLNDGGTNQSPTPVQHSSRHATGPIGPPPQPAASTSRASQSALLTADEPKAAQPFTPPAPALSPPAKTDSPLPPGMTADSLLSSILGGTGSPLPSLGAPSPARAANPGKPHHLVNDKPTAQAVLPNSTPLSVPPSHNQSPAPVLPSQISQTFPPSPLASLEHPRTASSQGQAGRARELLEQAASPSPAPSPLTAGHHGPQSAQPIATPPPPPNVPMLNALDETVAGRGPMGNVGRSEFVGNVLRAIHTDEAFVDELWWRYQQRTGGMR